MNRNTRRITMLARGPVGPTLFKLSAPAIAGMVVMAVYNVVDTVFVSLLRDTTAIAATGIVFPLFQLIGAVGLTFGMGAASVISRKLGANDYDAANQAGATAFYSSVGVGLALSLTGAIFITPILTLFGATETILEEATLYGRVILGGSVFQVVNMTTNNLLRSEGASGHSSIGQIIGAVLNIALDPIFIFALDMGVTGAAVATVIAQAGSTLFLLAYYALRKGVLAPTNPRHVRLRLATYRAIMVLGFPTFVRQILGSLSFGVLNNAAGFVLAPSIIRFFAPQDPAVVEMGSFAMRAMSVALIPIGLVVMFGGIFQALGDGRSALVLAAGQQGAFLIPLVLVLMIRTYGKLREEEATTAAARAGG